MVNNRKMYNGAYEIKVGAEKQLGSKLMPFLISQLATQL